MAKTRKKEGFSPLREQIHEVIFEADTPLGKIFDVVLLIFIIGSVLAVMLESVAWIDAKYHALFFALEWIFTIFFTIEYFLRIYCVYSPRKYIFSFFGIIDLLAILPAYLSLFLYGAQYLLVIRALRLLRIFRIFKLAKFLKEGNIIVRALIDSRAKLTVFIVFVLLLVIIMGSIMYLVEGGDNSEQFTSIPRSVYWAIVTLTTVGYGDIAPSTPFGQFLSAILMILGYAVIAVPTGIVSAEIANGTSKNDDEEEVSTQACRNCSRDGHDVDAEFCKFCGEELNHKHD